MVFDLINGPSVIDETEVITPEMFAAAARRGRELPYGDTPPAAAATPPVRAADDVAGGAARLFHGTNADVTPEQLRAGLASVNETTFGPMDVQRHGIFLTDNADFAAGRGSNVLEVPTNLRNTADLNVVAGELQNNSLVIRFVDSLDAFGPERNVWQEARSVRRADQLFDGQLGERFNAFLRSPRD
jgi:hypothetical protein